MKRTILTIIFGIMITTMVFTEESMTIQCENVTIEAPLGWLVQYTKTPSLLILYSPLEQNDTFQENGTVTIEALPSQYTVREYMDASVESLKSVYLNFELIESIDNYHVIIGIIGETTVQQVQYFFIQDNTAYIFSFTSNPENFGRYRKIFDSIAKTFRL